MSSLLRERVTEVHHWTDTLFTIKATRDPGFRFESGQFTMIGIEVDGKPLLRAYSIVSASYEDYLEFLSIKIPNGPLTSRLKHIKPGDTLLVNRKAVGTLLLNNLLPGKHLYLLSTGTGLAPFMSIIREPDVYERFEKIILVHGTRQVNELVYQRLIEQELREHEFLGEFVREKLIYYPTTTREPYRNQGRITNLMRSGKLYEDIGLPPLNGETDRLMLCGSPEMLVELHEMFTGWGLVEGSHSKAGQFVIEKAFAEEHVDPKKIPITE